MAPKGLFILMGGRWDSRLSPFVLNVLSKGQSTNQGGGEHTISANPPLKSYLCLKIKLAHFLTLLVQTGRKLPLSVSNEVRE